MILQSVHLPGVWPVELLQEWLPRGLYTAGEFVIELLLGEHVEDFVQGLGGHGPRALVAKGRD